MAKATPKRRTAPASGENVAAALDLLDGIGPQVDKAHGCVAAEITRLREQVEDLAEALDAAATELQRVEREWQQRYDRDVAEQRRLAAEREAKLRSVANILS
jgi:hypothetical protein